MAGSLAKPAMTDSSVSIPHAYTAIISLSSTEDLSLPANPTRKLLKRRAIHDARDHHRLPIEAPTAVVIYSRPSVDQRGFILSAMMRFFVFNHIDDDCKSLIADSMSGLLLQKGDVVFRQGQQSAKFFIVESGSVESLTSNKHLHTLHRGEGFGELALLHEMQTTFSVRACEETVLWAVDKVTFREILRETHVMQQEAWVGAIRKVGVFALLSDKQIDAVAQSAVRRAYTAGVVFNPDNLMHVILSGEAVKLSEDGTMHSGDYFGERPLLYGESSSVLVKATAQLQCLTVSSDDLHRVLGDVATRLIHHNAVTQAVSQADSFRHSSADQVSKLVASMKLTPYAHGETLSAGAQPLTVQILMKGRLRTVEGLISAPFFIDRSVDFLSQSINVDSDQCEIAEWPKHIFELCTSQVLHEPNVEKQLWFLRKVPIFNTLSDELLQEMVTVRAI